MHTLRRILAFWRVSTLKKKRTICTVKYGGSFVITLEPCTSQRGTQKQLTFPNCIHLVCLHGYK